MAKSSSVSTKKTATKKTASKKAASKKTSRSRKKTTDVESDSDATPEAAEDAAAGDSTEKKPAKKSAAKKTSAKSTKRTTRKKTAPTSEPVGDSFAAGILDDEPAPEAEEKPKTTGKKKTTRKKAAAKKKTTRSSRSKKTAAKEVDSFAADLLDPDQEPEPESTPEPAKASKRESPRKPRSTERKTRSSAPESSDDSDDDGRRRRRRRRGGRKNRRGFEDGKDRGDRGSSSRSGSGGKSRRGRPSKPPAANDEVTGEIRGLLELHPKGYGFLRLPEKNYVSQDDDAFVSSSFVEKYKLREGVLIHGDVGPGVRNQGPRLKGIHSIDGLEPDSYSEVRDFDDLTPITPDQQIRLETGQLPVMTRVIDLVAPIGKGQRALIVAPPRSGKTMLIQEIAESISINHPEIHLIMLLIDERPEEVTEMRRNINGEVIASSMDQEVESHVRLSELVFERAKRLAESGKDVVILFDSITRTARAFNKRIKGGHTGTGGVGVKALEIPRKLFGAARQFDEGGSLTVIATALIETGSRMDDVIFQEFKGTGNMELVLSREMAERRIWPAIDLKKSGTRREEKILPEDVYDGVTLMRRTLASLSPLEAMQQLTDTLKRFNSNEEFLKKIRSVM